jgi:hypothetical protein
VGYAVLVKGEQHDGGVDQEAVYALRRWRSMSEFYDLFVLLKGSLQLG